MSKTLEVFTTKSAAPGSEKDLRMYEFLMFYHLRVLHIKHILLTPPSRPSHPQLLPYLPPLLFLSSFMCCFLNHTEPVSAAVWGLSPEPVRPYPEQTDCPPPAAFSCCKHLNGGGLLWSSVFWMGKAIAQWTHSPCGCMRKIYTRSSQPESESRGVFVSPPILAGALAFTVSLPLLGAVLDLLNTWIN